MPNYLRKLPAQGRRHLCPDLKALAVEVANKIHAIESV